MIADALVWIGENAVAVSALGIAALAIGLAIYCAREMPALPETDEHASQRFIG